MSVQLSWAQLIVLGAAVKVDYLTLTAPHEINLPYGVWRSLVVRGLMRQVSRGWEITEKGREIILRKSHLINVIGLKLPQQKETPIMNGKLRYRVARTIEWWAVIDTSITKIKMHNDVVDKFKSREAARIRARELNLMEQMQNTTTGDAA